jgi:hypothetical protein
VGGGYVDGRTRRTVGARMTVSLYMTLGLIDPEAYQMTLVRSLVVRGVGLTVNPWVG